MYPLKQNGTLFGTLLTIFLWNSKDSSICVQAYLMIFFATNISHRLSLNTCH